MGMKVTYNPLAKVFSVKWNIRVEMESGKYNSFNVPGWILPQNLDKIFVSDVSMVNAPSWQFIEFLNCIVG